ncbi:hypothetical protein, partial [Priestia megaterium]|uniref:hypothetical protein n=1 Tax=Priestia megaterium TaxID=1404 RepID=UPI0035B65A7B
MAAVQSPTKLPNMIGVVGKAVGSQTVDIQNFNHKMVVISEQLSALRGIRFLEINLNRMDE